MRSSERTGATRLRTQPIRHRDHSRQHPVGPANGLTQNGVFYSILGLLGSNGGEGTTSSVNIPFKFTGKERDSESGLDNFGARHYSSSLGRFMSPDDEDGADSPGSPQSLNLYGYVQNNPTNAVDPDGHDCVFVQGNTAYNKTGDCTGISNGTYVPGTVDPHSGSYDPNTHTLTVSYTPYGNGPNDPKGLAVVADVYPTHPGLTESEKFAAAMTAGANNIDFISQQVVTQAATGVVGRFAGEAIEALAANRAATPALKVVINWAHRISDIRPGHLPPPGTQEEIQGAVEAAIKAGQYTKAANGVIEGTTEIHGVEIGFRGKLVGNEWRIPTVFTKR